MKFTGPDGKLYRQTANGTRPVIQGYSTAKQGGRDAARMRAQGKREAHYTNLPTRGDEFAQFRNKDGSPKMDKGETVPGPNGGSKVVMPPTKPKPVDSKPLPVTIARPQAQMERMGSARAMVDEMVPKKDYIYSSLDDMMKSVSRKKKRPPLL